MVPTKKVIGVLGIFILGIFTPDVYSQSRYSADEVLEILRAKDAQIDNALLEYVITGKHQTESFPAYKYPEVAQTHGWVNEKSEIIPVRYLEKLAVRGPDTTFLRELAPDSPKPKDPSISMIPYQKWSNTEGLGREITRHFTQSRGDAVLEILPGGLPVDHAQEQRMFIEFSLGVGYGKRIVTVDEIRETSDGYELEGVMRLWEKDNSKFKLTIDQQFIVRDAIINASVGKFQVQFETSTEGFVENGTGLNFAKNGGFKRITLGAMKDGVLKGKPRIKKEFAIEFSGIQTNLDDEFYQNFISFTPETGMQVFDRVAGVNYFVGEEPVELKKTIDDSMETIDTHNQARVVTTSTLAHDEAGKEVVNSISKTGSLSGEETRSQSNTPVFVILVFITIVFLVLVGVYWFKVKK